MYCAEVNWYDNGAGADVIEYILITADGWNEAMSIINSLFANINSIQMHEVTEANYKMIDKYIYDFLY